MSELTVVRAPGDVTLTGRAMASSWSIRVVGDDDPDATLIRTSIGRASEVFAEVDRTCTRFDDRSDLMRANRAPEEWHQVSDSCFDATVAAYRAYRRTRGRFDPRIYDDLRRLGYDQSIRVRRPQAPHLSVVSGRPPLPQWTPSFDGNRHRLRLGARIDLGGIGKGLAVDWVAARLGQAGAGRLVDAGGDCYAGGFATADGDRWHVGVEGRSPDDGPAAVLAVVDRGIATSSTRLLHWDVAGTRVHHLIDPATGLPGGDGLFAVTVVDDTAADAEVWSKVLFLAGARGVGPTAELFGVAALWIEETGRMGTSPAMAPYLAWSRP